MYKNILVPIALDHERDSNQSLKIAKVLADEGAKITALHIMEEIPSYVAQYLPEGQIEDNARQLQARLQSELGDLEGVETKVISGHAGHAIVDYATHNEIDCIVVASHRPGLTDFFLGSTAARVVRHAPCCVHVTR
ncbi:universal stress protein [Aliiroseovarius sp. KMU-50]|uniref:Universal stress protein n=1 Tax=Aliiroseovarius salicola TaxID=3009082 RepID=A0ABT4VZA5_9RHOB|nr:universal stress protein [Aliiroseovarius sp. KMU-50]MDA5093601.1 universal stress protein [Aliiroseovarius sp. KMU-50]